MHRAVIGLEQVKAFKALEEAFTDIQFQSQVERMRDLGIHSAIANEAGNVKKLGELGRYAEVLGQEIKAVSSSAEGNSLKKIGDALEINGKILKELHAPAGMTPWVLLKIAKATYLSNLKNDPLSKTRVKQAYLTERLLSRVQEDGLSMYGYLPLEDEKRYLLNAKTFMRESGGSLLPSPDGGEIRLYPSVRTLRESLGVGAVRPVDPFSRPLVPLVPPVLVAEEAVAAARPVAEMYYDDEEGMAEVLRMSAEMAEAERLSAETTMMVRVNSILASQILMTGEKISKSNLKTVWKELQSFYGEHRSEMTKAAKAFIEEKMKSIISILDSIKIYSFLKHEFEDGNNVDEEAKNFILNNTLQIKLDLQDDRILGPIAEHVFNASLHLLSPAARYEMAQLLPR